MVNSILGLLWAGTVLIGLKLARAFWDGSSARFTLVRAEHARKKGRLTAEAYQYTLLRYGAAGLAILGAHNLLLSMAPAHALLDLGWIATVLGLISDIVPATSACAGTIETTCQYVLVSNWLAAICLGLFALRRVAQRFSALGEHRVVQKRVGLVPLYLVTWLASVGVFSLYINLFEAVLVREADVGTLLRLAVGIQCTVTLCLLSLCGSFSREIVKPGDIR